MDSIVRHHFSVRGPISVICGGGYLDDMRLYEKDGKDRYLNIQEIMADKFESF